MTRRPLQLGPLQAAGYNLYRSAISWLLPPGSQVRAGQVFAYCAVSLIPDGPWGARRPAFAEETLQVAFASPVAGAVLAAGHERGGVLGVFSVEAWRPDDVVAYLEPQSGTDAGDLELRLLALAGRRVTHLAHSDAGLLPGWLERRRGWWTTAAEPPPTLLCLGLCDSSGAIAGEHNAFLETFERDPRAAHCVIVSERPLAFATPVVSDQFERTPAQTEAIAEDMRRAFAGSTATPTPTDWISMGGLLAGLRRRPITDPYALLTPHGVHPSSPAGLILLSLASEPRSLLRHRTLGYHVHIMSHHQDDAGPAFRGWLASAFEPVKRSLDDIRRDYERLIEQVAAATGARVAIVNRMSSMGHEDISSYAAFDSPMGDTLSTIAAKEANLMLHDLHDSHGACIIDLDALAAAFGGAEHVPDGIHQSGTIQDAVRGQVLEALHAPADALA